MVRLQPRKKVTMEALLGIDISKDWFDACLSFSFSSAEVPIERLSNSKQGFRSLLKDLKAKGVTKFFVCMEATGNYWKDLAKFLFASGITVYVVNPARIKAQRKMEQKRSKNDRIDAAVILRFLKSQLTQLKPWTPPSKSVEMLQSLVRFRESVVADRTRMKNLLKSLPASMDVASLARRRIEEAEIAIAEIEKQIDDLMRSDDLLQSQRILALSVPSVGPVTSAAVIAECRAFNEISSPRQCTAFAGLDVVEESSGTSVKKRPHISKQGSRLLRVAFVRAAASAVRSERGPFRSFYKRLLARGLKKRQALTATARKLLEITVAVVLSGSKFDPLHCAAPS
jgi:transposase